MSQICYDIVLELSRQDNHIRGLAGLLKTNQMTIARRVEELVGLNVLDFRIEGKNKVHFMKNSLEAIQYLKIAEQYKAMGLVSRYPRFRLIVEKINADDKIVLAILFGSYAKGNADKNSDIDVYIDVAEAAKRIGQLDSRLNIKTGEFSLNSPLAKEIIKNHVILKGVDNYYEVLKKA